MSNYPTNTTRNKKSNPDIIIEWFEGRLHDDELTEANREYFARVQACYRSMLKFEARSTTQKMLRKTFDIGRDTAIRIYADTEQIYGSVRKHNKEFKRIRAEEMALTAFRRAQDKGSATGMVHATNAYIRATGIEQETVEMPDFERLEPGDVITMLPTAIAEAIAASLTGGVIDLNQANYTIDIQHEEIPAGNSAGN